jgi:hypothetical protein
MYTKNGSRYAPQDATEDAYQDATPQRAPRKRATIKTPQQRADIARERMLSATARYDATLQHAERYSVQTTQLANAIYSNSHNVSAERIAKLLYRLARGGSNAERVLDRAVRMLTDGSDPVEDAPYNEDGAPQDAPEYERRATLQNEDGAPEDYYPRASW